MKIKFSELSIFIFIALSIGVYHLFFWDKYFGLQEGWGNTYAAIIQQGKIPYRDFYLFAQPLSVMLSLLLTDIFGNTIIALRIWGISERIVIAILLYLIYTRLVNKPIALLASLVSLIFYTGTTVDVIYDYVQTCLVFILFSTYLVLVAINSDHKKSALIFTAGILGGLAFLTKQTTGLITPFAILCFMMMHDIKQTKRLMNTCYYLLGFITPNVITYLILFHYNALHDYFNQVFFSSVGAKGGLFSIFFSAFIRTYKTYLIFLPFSLVILTLFIQQNQKIASQLQNKNKILFFLPIVVMTTAFALSYFVIITFNANDFVKHVFLSKMSLLFIINNLLILISAYLLFKLIMNSLTTSQWQWLLLMLVSASIIYAQGLSFTYSVYSLVLATGLFIILLYSLKTPANTLKNIVVSLGCVTLISGTLIQHCFWPYDWWGWKSTSVQLSTSETSLTPLAKIKMSAFEAKILTETTQIIQHNSKPSDSIFVFPHMPIFYLLSNRYPITWAPVDYFDVCSDACAKEDAARILQNPPKVMVIEDFPEPVWKFHEYLFRNGLRSGQRSIQDSINTLIQRYSYKKVASYPSTARGYTINVWVRPTSISQKFTYN